MTFMISPQSSTDEAAEAVARQLQVASLAPLKIAVLASLLDLIVLALGFWFGQFLLTDRSTFHAGAGAGVAAGVSLATVATLQLLRGYTIPSLCRPYRGCVTTLAASLPGFWVCLWVSAAPQPAPASVTTLLLVALATVVPVRLALGHVVNWAAAVGLTARRAVLIGGGKPALALMRGLERNPDNDIRVCAIFDDRADERSPALVRDIVRLGRIADLIRFSRTAEIDLVIITLPLQADKRIAALLETLRVLPIPVHLSALSPDHRFHDQRRAESALTLALPASFQIERRMAKRLFDLAIGGLALALFAPLMAVIALAIRMDSPGPVFFRQKREGFNSRPIWVLKFRTMHHKDSDPEARHIVQSQDPRVTRLGRVLRRSSLDELPQLFNVMAGSLSLVGPRPHVVNAVDSQHRYFSQIVDHYSARHRLPPGITGWAQINGWRGGIDDPNKLQQRVAHDLYYIENWSLWLDLKILLRTPASLFKATGAY